jgi:hypothetical protein
MEFVCDPELRERFIAGDLNVARLEVLAIAEQLIRHELGDPDAAAKVLSLSVESEFPPGAHAVLASELLGRFAAERGPVCEVLSAGLRQLVNEREDERHPTMTDTIGEWRPDKYRGALVFSSLPPALQAGEDQAHECDFAHAQSYTLRWSDRRRRPNASCWSTSGLARWATICAPR